MKTAYSLILVPVVTLLLAGCQQDNIPVPERNQMKLSGPAETIVLHEEESEAEVLTFEWTDATSIGDDYTFTYLFQLDIANNSFGTATIARTMEEGVRSVKFKTSELYDYIVEKWGGVAGQIVLIEGRVIAKVNGPKFMYPEIASTTVSVQTYLPDSQALYLLGTATDAGLDPTKALLMNEISNGRIYTWNGNLRQGNYKFITQLGSMLPSLNRGEQDTLLVARNTNEDPDNYFTVNQPGLYFIYLSKKEMKIRTSLMKYQHVYMVGDATVVGWDIDNPVEMIHDPITPAIFTVQTTLKAGELKLPTEKSWSAPAFRPMQADGSIADTDTQVISAADGANDIKWKVTSDQAGTYTITLDTENNKISFVKM